MKECPVCFEKVKKIVKDVNFGRCCPSCLKEYNEELNKLLKG